MRRIAYTFIILATATATAAQASHHRSHSSYRDSNDSISTSMSSDDDFNSCSDVRISINGESAARSEEIVPVGSMRSLSVAASANGGVHVIGSDRTGYEVTLCKAAAMESDLASIKPVVRGNDLTVAGPEREAWTAFYIIHAPRNADLTLDANNGPISVRDLVGDVRARAINGPIDVRRSNGKLDLETTNGPIELDGGSGNVKLRAENGPIDVKLDGSSWNGSLDARTENGPVAVSVPRNYNSGVVIEMNGHGPITCHSSACSDAKRTWGRTASADNDRDRDDDDDDDSTPRRIELGHGAQNVHLETMNGPVSVSDSRR